MKENRETTSGRGATHRQARVQETPRYPVHVRSTFVRVVRPSGIAAARYGKVGAE